MQLDIVELLLKGCKSLKNYEKKVRIIKSQYFLITQIPCLIIMYLSYIPFSFCFWSWCSSQTSATQMLDLNFSHFTVLCVWQCKKLVFEYGPLILVNAEEYLVKNDICTILRACPAQKMVLRQPSSADSWMNVETLKFSLLYGLTRKDELLCFVHKELLHCIPSWCSIYVWGLDTCS